MNLPRSRIIINCGQLVTFKPQLESQNFVVDSDIGILEKAWIRMEGNKIHSLGTGPAPAADETTDAQGRLVTPAYVDAHTHLLFAGDRSHEYAAKLAGASYQEIAAKGGGIRYTMQQTRQASDDVLLAGLLKRLARIEKLGTQTVEIKTGYGLSISEELRHLRLIQKAKSYTSVRIIVTCLALHAPSPDYPDRESYIDACRQELLPQLARERLCDFVDAFVEKNYFEPAMIDAFMTEARDRYRIPIRIHADEFADAGAALAAARWGASSADHLEEASDEGIAAMSAAGTVAVLLPGTSLYSKIPFAEASRFLNAGVPVALASDFNAGSCIFDQMDFIACLGARYNGLNAAQALAAVTVVAARSLRIEKKCGALLPGYPAECLIHEVPTIDHWVAAFGRNRSIPTHLNSL